MHPKLLLLFACLSLAKGLDQLRYDNYKLYKVQIEDVQQSQLLNENERALKLSSWREARHPGDYSDFMLPPQSQEAFEDLLNRHNFSYSVKIDNVQRLIDAQRPKQRTSQMEWTQYHTLDEIYASLHMTEAHYPIHSNEWITSATITYFIDELLVPGKPAVKDIARNVDWYIIHELNVDGFTYSHGMHYPQMMRVAQGFDDSLASRYGTEFTCGSSAATLYAIFGSGQDWTNGVKNITMPYTIELRDRGEYGFLLPPEYIIPVAREVTEGFVSMITAARGIDVL